VAVAKISVTDSELSLIDTQNQLRKEIEQACADVISAQSGYLASVEENGSTREAYDVTNEKFKQGLVSSVDFLVQKNNLISAESQLLQSKFSLIFGYKVLDFYKGIPLAL
jgi:outer membrane protein